MKITNPKLKIIVFFLTSMSLFFVFSKNVFANGTSLTVSPSVIEIQAKPPADAWAPFTIENQSDQSVNLTIGYKTFDPQASQNGNVTFLKNGQQIPGGNKKIFENMQVVDSNNISHSTLILGPKQKERLRLHIILANDEPNSDYYFSLIFLETSNKINQNDSKNIKRSQESISSLLTGIGIDILLAVGDKEQAQGNINDFSTNWFDEAGPIPFNLTVFNQSAHFISPKGIILIKNMFGQAIGKIAIPSTVILSGTGRSFINPQLIWRKHFLLGMYTATLYFTLSDNGPIYTRSIHFFVFPLDYLVETIVILVILSLIYSRLKKKMR